MYSIGAKPSQMGISQLRHLAAAGRTFDKAFFDKERLVNLFQRSGIFSQGSRDSRQSYRSAVKLVDDSRQQLIVLSPVQNHAHDAATRSLYGVYHDYGKQSRVQHSTRISHSGYRHCAARSSSASPSHNIRGAY